MEGLGKLLELLKDADWQLGVGLTCTICLIGQSLAHYALPSWVVPLLWLGMIFGGVMFAISLLNAWLRAL